MCDSANDCMGCDRVAGCACLGALSHTCTDTLFRALPPCLSALVNINDGMLGLTSVTGNVLFNGCRESDDHGNFNSWDRTPILHRSHDSWGAWPAVRALTQTQHRTPRPNGLSCCRRIRIRSGPLSWSPGFSRVSRNLVQNSYGAGHGIDHDDGSNFWLVTELTGMSAHTGVIL